ncbi:MAG TPA: hypothetical protein VM100_01185 [Longimicrobiales bacterium]|nr:hypothetical protein [Longimicrobiales bacterium]
MTEQNKAGVPEDRVATILQRAAEIERLPATVQPEMIRAAALEAGISPDAIDRALEEFATVGIQRAEPAPVPVEVQPKKSLRSRIWKKLTHPVGLIGIAILAGLAADQPEVTLILGVILLWLKLVFIGLRWVKDFIDEYRRNHDGQRPSGTAQ